MTISDEDLDEIHRALGNVGYAPPYTISIQDYPYPQDLHDAEARAERMNREALRKALEGTQAWHRWRIY